MMEELYMVLADGWWYEGYGSYVDFVGIFYTKDQAEGVIKQQPAAIRESCRIVPVIVGEIHNMEPIEPAKCEYTCGFRLGGYAE